MNFDDFYYVRIPQPIAVCGRFSRLETTVFGAIFAAQKMRRGNPVKISTREIARRIGSSRNRRNVRSALERLAEEGTVERLADGRWRTVVPNWIEDGFAHLVRDTSQEDTGDWDEDVHGVERTPGGGSSGPRRGGRADPPRSISINRERNRSRGAPPHDPAEDQREAVAANINEPVEEVEEVEEINIDDESRAAAESIEAERKARAGRAKRPRRKRVATPSNLQLREPSRRPEMNRWREKDPSGRGWSARDVVGFFVCRYKDEVREEPTEFFATSDAIFRHHRSNVAQYTKRGLEGDYRRARALVEKILLKASDRGMPVKLGYFFTPARESTALRLDEDQKPGRRTPAERNDEVGDYEAHREYWDQKRAEFEARERERRENEREAGKVYQADEGA